MDTLTDLLTAKIRQLETTLDHVGAYVYTKDMALKRFDGWLPYC